MFSDQLTSKTRQISVWLPWISVSLHGHPDQKLCFSQFAKAQSKLCTQHTDPMDGLTKKACKANGALRLDPTSLTHDIPYPDASCPGEGPLGFDVSCIQSFPCGWPESFPFSGKICLINIQHVSSSIALLCNVFSKLQCKANPTSPVQSFPATRLPAFVY